MALHGDTFAGANYSFSPSVDHSASSAITPMRRLLALQRRYHQSWTPRVFRAPAYVDILGREPMKAALRLEQRDQ